MRLASQTSPASRQTDGLERHPQNTRVLAREFRGVMFGYEPQKPVLHEISFVVDPGRTIAFVRHTGSGKTSIINLVAKFYLPQLEALRCYPLKIANGHILDGWRIIELPRIQISGRTRAGTNQESLVERRQST